MGGTTAALEDRLGRLRLTATSAVAAKPLFVGIARTEDIDRYLAGVEHDELRDIEFDPFRIDYRRLGAGAQPALPTARSIGELTRPAPARRLSAGRSRRATGRRW